MLTPEELRQVLPAETAAFPAPIPTQCVSSDEYADRCRQLTQVDSGSESDDAGNESDGG